jgi:WD40 repeat protein
VCTELLAVLTRWWSQTSPISAIAVSRDKRWAVTVDSGVAGASSESLLVVWDTQSRVPVRSIVRPHPGGCVAVALSPSGMHIATVSTPFEDPETGVQGVQEIAVWDWSDGSRADEPLARSRVPPSVGLSSSVEFHPHDAAQLATTGPERVVFWGVDPPTTPDAVCSMSFFVPAISRAGMEGAVAGLTSTAFLPSGTEAVTGTTDGCLLLWNTSAVALSEGRLLERGAAKLVRLLEEDARLPPSAPGLPPAPIPVTCVQVLSASSSDEGEDAAGPGLAGDADASDVASSASTVVIVAFGDGTVRAYDGALRLVAWFDDIAAGPVTSVSFGLGTLVPGDVGRPPVLPDFVVGTSRGLVVGMASALLDELDPDARRGTLLLQGFESGVFGMATHPTEALVLTGTRQGTVSVWDVRSRELQIVRMFHDEAEEEEQKRLRAGGEPRPPAELFGDGAFAITCAAWHPGGGIVAVAVGARAAMPQPARGVDGVDTATPGYIRVLDADSLEDVQAPLGNRRALRGAGFPTQPSSQGAGMASLDGSPGGAITILQFSQDGSWLAAVDSAGFLCLWRYSRVRVRGEEERKEWQLSAGEEDTNVKEESRWVYIGRARPHTGDIVGIEWVTDPTDRTQRLVSVGTDRRVSEVDIPRSSLEAGIVIRRPRVKVEHTATPTACMWFHPKDSGSTEASSVGSELLLGVATDELKIRLFSAGTKACRKTIAAPDFCGPIASLRLLRGRREGAPGVVMFGAAERTVGASLLPLDGNPHGSVGVLAHPGQITAMEPVAGDRIVTSGGDDGTLVLWKVHRGRLAELRVRGGTDMEPFLETLPGGGGGAFFQELCDFFAYAQMRSQGEDSTAPRKTGDTLPLTELPSLMRALGVFPTEAEAEALKTEVRYGQFGESGKTRENVDLAEAVRLFVNHRPAMGVGKGALQDAIRVITKHTDAPSASSSSAVRWAQLKRMLLEKGEAMSEQELVRCLTSLTGKKEPFASDSFVTADSLAFDLLGFVSPTS